MLITWLFAEWPHLDGYPWLIANGSGAADPQCKRPELRAALCMHENAHCEQRRRCRCRPDARVSARCRLCVHSGGQSCTEGPQLTLSSCHTLTPLLRPPLTHGFSWSGQPKVLSCSSAPTSMPTGLPKFFRQQMILHDGGRLSSYLNLVRFVKIFRKAPPVDRS